MLNFDDYVKENNMVEKDKAELTLVERVMLIEAKVDRIYEMMVKTDNAVAMIVEQVKPTLDELSRSPILKMLGMKK